MPPEESVWYRLGYAAERALARVKPGESPPDPPREEEKEERSLPAPTDVAGRLLEAGLGAVAVRLVDHWGARGEGPGLVSLFRAGVAGAAAALLVELARPLLTDQELALDRELAEELLVGAGSGLVYAALAEPRLPGPRVVRGTLYGTADYLVSPWGGLGSVLGPLTPQKKIPLLGSLLEDGVPSRRSYVEHLAFAIALAELYGSAGGD